VSGKNVQVAFEGKSDAQCLWMRENFCQYIVQKRISSQGDEINQVGSVFITELEQGRPHGVKFSHCGSPLGVHSDDRSPNKLSQLLALRDVANELHLDMCGESQTRSFRDWPKLVDWHVIKLGIVLNSGQVLLERLTGVIVLGQVMSMPNTSSFLEVNS